MSILVAVWLPSPSHLISMRAPFFQNLSGITYFAISPTWHVGSFIYGLFLQFTTAELRFKAESRLACIELADNNVRQTATNSNLTFNVYRAIYNGFVSKWAFPKIPHNGDVHREQLMINGSLVWLWDDPKCCAITLLVILRHHYPIPFLGFRLRYPKRWQLRSNCFGWKHLPWGCRIPPHLQRPRWGMVPKWDAPKSSDWSSCSTWK